MKQILGNRQHGNVAGTKDHDGFFLLFFFFFLKLSIQQDAVYDPRHLDL